MSPAVIILSGILACIGASPIPLSILGFATTDSSTATAETEETPSYGMISFKDGTLHLNILGSKASVGLGGLITWDIKDGGPHVDVGTLFGLRAGAGVFGHPEGDNSTEYHSAYAYADDAILGIAKMIESWLGSSTDPSD